jgi:hypothetical protein
LLPTVAAKRALVARRFSPYAIEHGADLFNYELWPIFVDVVAGFIRLDETTIRGGCAAAMNVIGISARSSASGPDVSVARFPAISART